MVYVLRWEGAGWCLSVPQRYENGHVCTSCSSGAICTSTSMNCVNVGNCATLLSRLRASSQPRPAADMLTISRSTRGRTISAAHDIYVGPGLSDASLGLGFEPLVGILSRYALASLSNGSRTIVNVRCFFSHHARFSESERSALVRWFVFMFLWRQATPLLHVSSGESSFKTVVDATFAAGHHMTPLERTTRLKRWSKSKGFPWNRVSRSKQAAAFSSKPLRSAATDSGGSCVAFECRLPSLRARRKAAGSAGSKLLELGPAS